MDGRPQRLIDFTDGRVIARWPRTDLDNLVNIDFDRKSKIWITYAHWDHHRSIPLKEWLTLAATNVAPGGHGPGTTVFPA